MEARIKNLLEKIKFPEEKMFSFENATLSKIVVVEESNTWNIYLKNKTNFKYDDLKTFLTCLENYVNKKYTYNIFVEPLEEDLSLYEDYFKNILVLINNNNLFFDMFSDRLINENNDFYIEVYNKAEEITLNKKLDCINKYFKKFGFNTLPKVRYNSEKNSSIKEEIESLYKVDEEKLKSFNALKIEEVEPSKKEFKSGNFEKKTYSSKKGLFGEVKGPVTKLNDISYEVDNISVEVQIFEVVPSTKKGFNSLTLKVTDFSTSMYVRIFARSEEEYEELLSKFKEGMWLRIAGYVKNNNFYNDFVINARTIEIIEKKENIPMDEEDDKRVELHIHTTMSQMDGVVSASDIIKRAIKWGHKAIAITDHNAIQTFPAISKFKNDIKVLFLSLIHI